MHSIHTSNCCWPVGEKVVAREISKSPSEEILTLGWEKEFEQSGVFRIQLLIGQFIYSELAKMLFFAESTKEELP